MSRLSASFEGNTVPGRLLDWKLWLALAAGPAVWFALALIVHPGFRPGWPLAKPWVFITLCLIYPVLEEIVFRGLLQDWLAQRFKRRALYGLSAANVVTSLIFAALHFIYHPPLYAALVLFPSLVFGYFRERHATLATPIALHIWYNAGYFFIFGL